MKHSHTKPQNYTDYWLITELLTLHRDTSDLLRRIQLSGTYFDNDKTDELTQGLKTCDDNLKIFWN